MSSHYTLPAIERNIKRADRELYKIGENGMYAQEWRDNRAAWTKEWRKLSDLRAV